MISVDNAKKHPEVWIEQNKKLIHKIVNKFAIETAKFSRDDLMQEAHIFALRAIEAYEEGNSAKLSSYVYLAVSRACRDFVRKNKYDLYCSSHQQEKMMNAKKEGRWMPNPTALSADAVISRNMGEEKTLGATIPSGSLSVLDTLVKKEQIEILYEEMGKLTEREQSILHAYYWQNATLRDIASVEGCSFQRVGTIAKRALNKLATGVKKRLEDELFV